MSYSFQGRLAPEYTPKPIRYILWAIALVSLCSALLDPLLSQYLNFGGLKEVLPLSTFGVRRYWLWQAVTYFFIISSPMGIDVFYLIHLGLSLYFFWVLGTSLYEYLGQTSFYRYFIGLNVGLGLAAMALLSSTQIFDILAGPQYFLLSLFGLWIMVYPETQVMLFFLIPIPAKWIFTPLAGGAFLICLSQGYILSLLGITFGILTTYLYGIIARDLRSPFPPLQKFEDKISRLTAPVREKNLYADKSLRDLYQGIKIFDFKTGTPKMNDEEFVDAMLNKISLYGEDALTNEERKRLHAISKKREREQ